MSDTLVCYEAAFVGHNSEIVWSAVQIFRPTAC